MSTIKQEAINAIDSLPDNATIDDIMYRLYVINKINRGREAFKVGRTLTPEDLKREVRSW